MNWLFGKKKKDDVKMTQKTESKTTSAIQNNQATYERLEKRQRLLQKKMDLEAEKAKEFAQKGNKPGMCDPIQQQTFSPLFLRPIIFRRH